MPNYAASPGDHEMSSVVPLVPAPATTTASASASAAYSSPLNNNNNHNDFDTSVSRDDALITFSALHNSVMSRTTTTAGAASLPSSIHMSSQMTQQPSVAVPPHLGLYSSYSTSGTSSSGAGSSMPPPAPPPPPPQSTTLGGTLPSGLTAASALFTRVPDGSMAMSISNRNHINQPVRLFIRNPNVPPSRKNSAGAASATTAGASSTAASAASSGVPGFMAFDLPVFPKTCEDYFSRMRELDLFVSVAETQNHPVIRNYVFALIVAVTQQSSRILYEKVRFLDNKHQIAVMKAHSAWLHACFQNNELSNIALSMGITGTETMMMAFPSAPPQFFNNNNTNNNGSSIGTTATTTTTAGSNTGASAFASFGDISVTTVTTANATAAHSQRSGASVLSSVNNTSSATASCLAGGDAEQQQNASSVLLQAARAFTEEFMPCTFKGKWQDPSDDTPFLLRTTVAYGLVLLCLVIVVCLPHTVVSDAVRAVLSLVLGVALPSIRWWESRRGRRIHEEEIIRAEHLQSICSTLCASRLSSYPAAVLNMAANNNTNNNSNNPTGGHVSPNGGGGTPPSLGSPGSRQSATVPFNRGGTTAAAAGYNLAEFDEPSSMSIDSGAAPDNTLGGATVNSVRSIQQVGDVTAAGVLMLRSRSSTWQVDARVINQCVMIVMCDREEHRISYWSEHCEMVTGFCEGDVFGHHVWAFLADHDSKQNMVDLLEGFAMPSANSSRSTNALPPDTVIVNFLSTKCTHIPVQLSMLIPAGIENVSPSNANKYVVLIGVRSQSDVFQTSLACMLQYIRYVAEELQDSKAAISSGVLPPGMLSPTSPKSPMAPQQQQHFDDSGIMSTTTMNGNTVTTSLALGALERAISSLQTEFMLGVTAHWLTTFVTFNLRSVTGAVLQQIQDSVVKSYAVRFNFFSESTVPETVHWDDEAFSQALRVVILRAIGYEGTTTSTSNNGPTVLLSAPPRGQRLGNNKTTTRVDVHTYRTQSTAGNIEYVHVAVSSAKGGTAVAGDASLASTAGTFDGGDVSMNMYTGAAAVSAAAQAITGGTVFAHDFEQILKAFERHGGRIDVEYMPFSVTTTLRFPLLYEMATSQAPQYVRAGGGGGTTPKQRSFASRRGSKIATSSPRSPGASPRSNNNIKSVGSNETDDTGSRTKLRARPLEILMFEGTPVFAMGLLHYLWSRTHNVTHVYTQVEALQLMEERVPDVVIWDADAPDDGSLDGTSSRDRALEKCSELNVYFIETTVKLYCNNNVQQHKAAMVAAVTTVVTKSQQQQQLTSPHLNTPPRKLTNIPSMSIDQSMLSGGGVNESMMMTGASVVAGQTIAPNASLAKPIKEPEVDAVLAKAREHREEKEERERQVASIKNLFSTYNSCEWERGDRIGRGACGEVFIASIPLTGARMAVKVVALPDAKSTATPNGATTLTSLNGMEPPHAMDDSESAFRPPMLFAAPSSILAATDDGVGEAGSSRYTTTVGESGLMDDPRVILALKERTDEVINEIDILREMDHPHVIHYFYCERGAKSVNIFMEYAPGGSLASWLEKHNSSLRKKAVQVRLVRMLREVVEAVAYIHALGVVHRDIKAANILLSDSKAAKLSDFGSAARMPQQQQQQQQQQQGLMTSSSSGMLQGLKGTMRWMAPEVMREDYYDESCDVWSIGCLAIEMFTGSVPFTNISANSNIAVFRVLSCLGYDAVVDHGVAEDPTATGYFLSFLDCCLQVDPEKRSDARTLLAHPFLTHTAKHAAAKAQQQQQQHHLSYRRTSVDSGSYHSSASAGSTACIWKPAVNSGGLTHHPSGGGQSWAHTTTSNYRRASCMSPVMGATAQQQQQHQQHTQGLQQQQYLGFSTLSTTSGVTTATTTATVRDSRKSAVLSELLREVDGAGLFPLIQPITNNNNNNNAQTNTYNGPNIGSRATTPSIMNFPSRMNITPVPTSLTPPPVGTRREM
eukprot:PhM_4_TR13731/c5_g1_i1/m.25188